MQNEKKSVHETMEEEQNVYEKIEEEDSRDKDNENSSSNGKSWVITLVVVISLTRIGNVSY